MVVVRRDDVQRNTQQRLARSPLDLLLAAAIQENRKPDVASCLFFVVIDRLLQQPRNIVRCSPNKIVLAHKIPVPDIHFQVKCLASTRIAFDGVHEYLIPGRGIGIVTHKSRV